MTNSRFLITALVVCMAFVAHTQQARATVRYHVSVDPMAPLVKAYPEMGRELGMPMLGEAAEFDIAGPDNPTVSPSQRKDLVDQWEEDLAGLAEGQGFVEQDIDDMAVQQGTSTEALRAMILKAQPYSQREEMSRRFAREFHILAATSAACSQGPRPGVLMAVVLGLYPDEDENSQYGAVTLIFLGIGECGRPAQTSRFMQTAKDRVRKAFILELERPE